MFENKNNRNISPYTLSTPEVWSLNHDNDVLKLDWNEATIKPSPNVLIKINKVLNEGKLNWYPNINNTELINKLSNYNSVKNNQVQYFASSDCLHEYIVRAFVDNADRVLSISPTYDNFRAVAESNGAHVQFYDLDFNFDLDFDKFNKDLKLIKPKVVYIVNPNNPTGSLFSSNDLYKLIHENKNILFIIDEAYFEFSNETVSSFVSELNNLLISRTFSKAFALASFRIGYLISCSKNIEIINKIRNPKNISLFAQEAAIAALDDISYTKNYVKSVGIAKTNFMKFLKTLDWMNPVEGAGNFIFIELGNTKIKIDLINYLKTNKIFIRDYGHIEKTKNYVRITIGNSEQMQIVKSKIINFSKNI
ncbi:histidinol-phosphate aminotransferase family protein [Flavobacteriaceae bacterium]|nr:histidinol-phosphate aminotransferase family protein [Flavobacteriaceae bacterium]